MLKPSLRYAVIVAAAAVSACNGTEPPPPPPVLEGSVVFLSHRSGARRLHIMKIDGSDVRQLVLPMAGVPGGPAVSPDGQWVAFTLGGDIHMIRPDGTDLSSIVTSGIDDRNPGWSPDGTMLAFDSDEAGSRDIYVMAVDGSERRQITSDPANDSHPAWSPAGDSLVFHSNRGGNFDIYVVDANGGTPAALTVDPAVDQAPSWSFGGGSIAFISQRNFITQAFVMDADGSNQRSLTGDFAATPAWLPGDGEIILSLAGEIQRVRVADGRVVNLTNDTTVDLRPAPSP